MKTTTRSNDAPVSPAIVSVLILIVIYLSSPFLPILSPEGVLDALASATTALALTHVAFLLPRRPACLLAAIIVLCSIVFNVSSGLYYSQQQTFPSLHSLYLATEVHSLVAALHHFTLLAMTFAMILGAGCLYLTSSYARPRRFRSRVAATLSLILLAATLQVTYASKTDESNLIRGDYAPLGHMVRSTGYIPFVKHDIEIVAKQARDALVKMLRKNPEISLPEVYAATSLGGLLGYDEQSYANRIGNPRFPLHRDLDPKLGAANQPGASPYAPNVLILVMESLRASEMGLYGARHSATPFLDSLAPQLLYADTFYATTNFTVKSEHAIHCSNLDFLIGRPVAMREDEEIRTPCLPQVLADNGYETLWIHGNSKNFYNREWYLPRIGFQQTLSRDELDPNNDIELLGWGISDPTIFDMAIERLEAQEGPFYAEVLTVSNHMPFDYDWGIEFPEYLQHESTMYERYRRGIYYSDQALKHFYERFEASNLADNTILLITGDHGIWTFPETGLSELQKNEMFFRVPLLIRTPDKQQGVIRGNASHLDIVPTLHELLGRGELRYGMGRSLLFDGQRRDRVLYQMTEQALSYRFSNRVCIPSVQCQSNQNCYRDAGQQVAEQVCYALSEDQDLLLSPVAIQTELSPLRAAHDRLLFDYSQIALQIGTVPDTAQLVP